jgi:4-diphosphocytidyl-2-C-methyl-D-erythritol kinase
MTSCGAPAKINLALAVGPKRDDGLHEVATLLQRIDLCDRIDLEPDEALTVEGFPADTLVRRALEVVAAAAGVDPTWRATIEKRIPAAAGLGGGSSDAAAALRLANASLGDVLPPESLNELARTLGADVPFFLRPGPQLGTGDGSTLEVVDLPQDYAVLVILPHGVVKESTASVYAQFDRAGGFEQRRAAIIDLAANASAARDLARLPRNDLAWSPLARELESLGAFRADVSGAGPSVYGLFDDDTLARRAARALAGRGRGWIALPAWYV